jgi:hypothetical protein
VQLRQIWGVARNKKRKKIRTLARRKKKSSKLRHKINRKLNGSAFSKIMCPVRPSKGKKL